MKMENDNHVSLSFFSVGDLVKVKAFDSSGALIALEVEIEVHDDDNSSDDDSSDDSNKGSKGNKNSDLSAKKSKKIRIRLRTKLRGEDTRAKGHARRKAKIRGDRSRDRIKIKVNVPIPSSNPELASEDAASSLSLMALFSREGSPYASCSLEFDEVEQKDNGPVAEYKTDIRIRTREGRDDRLRVKKGSCDTDISTDTLEQGVPNVSAGDTIEILEVTESGQNSFLSGSF